MMRSALKRGWDAFKEWGNTVPDCPSCNGTGEDTRNYQEYTYWKGQLHRVCIQCKGSGKV